MFHLVHKGGNSGGKNFVVTGIDSLETAIQAARDSLTNSAITEVTIVEARAVVRRTVNTEVIRL